MDEEKKKKDFEMIEKLQKELYSRESPEVLNEKRHSFKKQNLHVREEWGQDHKGTDLSEIVPKGKKPASILKKLLITSAVFFVLASLLAFFVIFGGFNFTSSQKVDIQVTAPASVEGGQELKLSVAVLNNNKSAIEDVVMTLEYPEGARNTGDPLAHLTRDSKTIDRIEANSKDSLEFESLIYGEKQSVKKIRILLEYKVENSAAILRTEDFYEVGIKSAPISITADFQKEVSSGQEVEFRINVASNSDSPLTGLILTAQYPFGFAPTESNPGAVFDDKVWSLGTIKKGDKKEIIIRGTMSGQEDEEKIFKFAVGSESPIEERTIGIEFVSQVETIIIRKPFLALSMEINKTLSGDYVSKMGSDLGFKLDWVNNLAVDLNDAVFEVTFDGESIDEFDISVGQEGFYKSQENKIIWDKNTTDELSRIRPGQDGTFTFTVGTIKPSFDKVSQFKNSDINVTVNVKGVRFYESQAPENVTTSIERKIKIETDLDLSPRIVYSVGPFNNFGPIPPKAEEITTYTIIWSLSSNWNDADNVVVTAKLPIYVDWIGAISPSSSQVVFNEDTRIISWNAGRINSGTGFSSGPKEVAFQLGFTPSIAQVGSVPVILEDPSVIGTDTFTSTDVTDSKPSLTTRITTDPIYDFGKERVVN